MSELDRILARYIDAFLGPAPSSEHGEVSKRMELGEYFKHIINSNISPAALHDEQKLVEDIQKKLFATNQDTRAALRVSQLHKELKRLDPAQDWWPMLYLMAECSASNLSSSVLASGNYMSSHISSRGLGSIFADQVPHKHLPDINNTLTADYSELNDAGPEEYSPRGIKRPSPSRGVLNEEILLHRSLPTFDDITESELLQDLIFVMQGIDGSYIRWNNRVSAYCIRPDVRLSRPTRTIVTSLSELGCLYRAIQEYIDLVDSRGHLFEQSFCSELKVELEQYFKLVAVLEAQISKVPSGLQPGESQLGLTLRRLYAWTREPLQKLRLMDSMIIKAQNSKGGGDLLSNITAFSENGDPFVHSFSKRMLKTASVPFNEILVRWVADGELDDPYREFFIHEREKQREMFWTEKYTVIPDMIPVHINVDMTRKIFLIGKSLNFLRVACDDAQWVVENGPRTQLIEDLSDSNALEKFVYRSSSMVNARLMGVLLDKFHLMEHISAIRRYLLFVQGDFVLSLMDVLNNQIRRTGGSIMAYELSAALSSSLRSSNAQYDSQEFLSSILLKVDKRNGGQDWDNVYLSYNVAAPLSYIIPNSTMSRYADISRSLLKLKRVEHALNSLWRRQMTASRSMSRGNELRRRRSASATQLSTDSDLEIQRLTSQAIHQSEVACSEMIQFFHQVQRYISLNVIEGAWGEFLESTKPESSTGHHREIDIDTWSLAHSKYVEVIHDVVCGSGLGLLRKLSSVLDTARQFINIVNDLYSEQTLNQTAASLSETRNKRSLSSIDAMHSTKNGDSSKTTLLSTKTSLSGATSHANRVQTIVARFKSQVKEIMRVFSHNTTSDLQFLVVTVDFNKFYTGSVDG